MFINLKFHETFIFLQYYSKIPHLVIFSLSKLIQILASNVMASMHNKKFIFQKIMMVLLSPKIVAITLKAENAIQITSRVINV